MIPVSPLMPEKEEKLPQLGDWRNASELRQRQLERLPEVIEHARRSSFYRHRLDAKTWEEIPLTTKKDLRRAYPFGLLAVDAERIASYHESTGTTGAPTASFFTERDWFDVASRCARNGIGLNASDWLLIKSGYVMYASAHQIDRAARLKGASIIPADSLSGNMPYRRVIQLLHDLPISITWSIPTEVLLWAVAARHAGLDPASSFPNLRGMVVMGEPLGEEKRARMQSIWGGARVLQDYGSTETGSLAGECGEGNLHLWADRLYFELYDKRTGRFVTEGRGELVVTPLYREAMPLVRYHLEDIVEISHRPCACGWGLPTARILGRPSGRFQIDGREIYPVQLESVVYSLPASRGVLFWRAQHSPSELQLEIAAGPGQAAAAIAELTDLARERLGVTPRVRAIAQEELVAPSLFESRVPLPKPQFVFSSEETPGHIIGY